MRLFYVWDASEIFANYVHESKSLKLAKESYYYHSRAEKPYAHKTWIEVREDGVVADLLRTDEEVEAYNEPS